MPTLEGFSPLGKVGLVNKGVYSEDNRGPFDKYDFVQYGTNTYMATQDGVSGPPSENTDGWQILAKGVTGTAASISGATVEVDNGVGEPSARVEVSGEDTNRTFAFHFNNLKGETGEQGPEGAQGLQGEQGERGPQGLQGEQGVGVSSLAIDDQKHLKVTLTDENTVDAGAIALNKEAIVEGLGYEPAGGKNLVLDSAQEISNANYLISKYTLSEPFKLNKTYTITIWGELAEGKVGFSAYVGTDKNDVSDNLKKVSDGVYSGICRKSSWFNGIEPNTEILMIFSSPDTVNKISNIHRIKLEPGNVTDPVWTPSPEDVANVTELNVVKNKIGPIEYLGETMIGESGNVTLPNFGQYVLFARQGGAWSICGMALINLSTVSTGIGVYKIIGDPLFTGKFNLSLDLDSKTLKIANSTGAAVWIRLFKIF